MKTINLKQHATLLETKDAIQAQETNPDLLAAFQKIEDTYNMGMLTQSEYLHQIIGEVTIFHNGLEFENN